MRISCPLCGSRDIREFTVKGDAVLLERPDTADADFDSYLHRRANPAGTHKELMYHEAGCRAWLVVTRDTVTHAIHEVTLAEERG